MEGCQDDGDCQDGYICLSSGFCWDLDECEEPNGLGIAYCGANAQCTNTIGSFTCACHSGFENHVANQGCTDIDECALDTADNCKLGTDCTNTPGSYTCACRSGYVGDPYVNCYDIDECADGGRYACTFGPKTGLPDMACINMPGTYQCVDTAVMIGGNSGAFQMIKAVNRDHPL